MKETIPDDELPFYKDGDFQYADYDVEEETILRRVMELLLPDLATDPLAPAIWSYLGREAAELCGYSLAAEFARLEHEACVARHGPRDHYTISARRHLADCRRLARKKE